MPEQSGNRRVLTGMLLVCAGFCGCTDGESPPGRPAALAGPSIILITVDTLRPDRLESYGYHRDTSPNIDRLAADSLVFDNCLAHGSATWSAIASLMTGFLPHETTVIKNTPLPGEVETIAEILTERGYRTAAVVSNYVLRDGRGYEQGFELFDSQMDQSETVRDLPERIAGRTTDRAIELLEVADERPLFFWVHYQDPHGPYIPPGGYAERYLLPAATPRELPLHKNANGYRGIPSYQQLGEQRDYHYYSARYDGEIRYLDAELGRLFAALERLGLYDRALIVFTADHGESMGEHEFYFVHGQHLYGDATRVPLILRYGDSFSGRRADFVQHLDLLPTVRGLLGLEADDRLRGGDLRQPQPADRTIVSQMSFRASLIRDGFKLIHTPPERRFELFDLASDPGEMHNLFGLPEHEQRARELTDRLGRVFTEDRLALRATDAPPAPTAEELEKLKALGYTD